MGELFLKVFYCFLGCFVLLFGCFGTCSGCFGFWKGLFLTILTGIPFWGEVIKMESHRKAKKDPEFTKGQRKSCENMDFH